MCMLTSLAAVYVAQVGGPQVVFTSNTKSTILVGLQSVMAQELAARFQDSLATT